MLRRRIFATGRAADIQHQCWIDVPHLPLGVWYQPVAWQNMPVAWRNMPVAWRNMIDGIPDGFPMFWGARRA